MLSIRNVSFFSVMVLQITSCKLFNAVNISELKLDENILCGNERSIDVVNNQPIVFRASVYPSREEISNAGSNRNDLDLVAYIEAKAADGKDSKDYVLLGKHFTKSSKFSFRGITWEILNLSQADVMVSGKEWCDGPGEGFIHVKHVK